MNTIELATVIISILISILALVVSVLSYKRSSSIAMGGLEIALRDSLNNSIINVHTSSVAMIPLLSKQAEDELTTQEAFQLDALKKIFDSNVENNLNVYEEACAKYIDNKTDKKRFKKMFRDEIKQLVESKDFDDKFHPHHSKYKAILRVYDEWENLEK